MAIISHDSEIPARGQQVITACAFIHQQFDGIEKVFLARRAKTKKFMPDVYELLGGHIDYRENIVEGLKREVMEEISMTVTIGDAFHVFDYVNDIKGSHSVQITYFGQFVGDINAITLQPEDHSDAGWFAEDELERAVTKGKDLTNPEFLAVKKGFALLAGESPTFS